MCTRHCWATTCATLALLAAVLGLSLPWYVIFGAFDVAILGAEAGGYGEIFYTWQGAYTDYRSCGSLSSEDCHNEHGYKGDLRFKNLTSWEDLNQEHVHDVFTRSLAMVATGTGLVGVGLLVLMFGMCFHVSAKHCHAGAIKGVALVLVSIGSILLLLAALLFIDLPNAFAQEDMCTVLVQDNPYSDKTMCNSFAGASTSNSTETKNGIDYVLVWWPVYGWFATLFAAAFGLCSSCFVAVSRHHRHHHHGSYAYTYSPIQS